MFEMMHPLPPAEVADAMRLRPPSCIVVDLDGTCLDAEQQMHDRTRQALEAAAHHVPVIVATGRMYCSALPWAQYIATDAPLICYQGAMIRTQKNGDMLPTTIYEQAVPRDVAAETIALARAHGWHRQIYVDDLLYCEEDREEAWLYANIADVPIQFVDDLDALAARGTTKVVLVLPDAEKAKHARSVVTDAFGARARVVSSLRQFVEVSHVDASKGQALARLGAWLGVDPREALVFGDAGNDIDMLDLARYGVAVEDADASVKVHATWICPGPQDGGVGQFLEQAGLAGAAMS